MLAKVTGCAVVGLTGERVSVEVDIASGLPAFHIVGLPDAAVTEAKERVRSAIRNAGAEFPQKRITVNMAPADLRKEGAGYDLPIAVGILIAPGQLPARVEDTVYLGELALDGHLRHVQGALPVAAAALAMGFTRLVLPAVDAQEAALIDDIEVFGLESVRDLIHDARGDRPIVPYDRSSSPPAEAEVPWTITDFSDVRGQEHVKRGLEVAAAGGTIFSWPGPRARARRCWPGPCRVFCRHSATTKRSR